MALIQITDTVERATVMLELHKHWKPTMKVSIWGRGKATLVNREECPDNGVTGGQKYSGNCDECNYFMGAKFTKGKTYLWGDHAKACCGLELEAALEVQP